MSLEGKTILVTGSSSGIGRAIAIECSKLGATVILTARNEERLKETLSLMEGSGHSYYVGDMNKEEETADLAAELPKLDGVSHNAGIALTMLNSFMKNETVRNLIQTNLLSPMVFQGQLLKQRKIKKNASLVFTASTASIRSGLGNGFYAASKAGLVSYVKGLARELGSKGIRANCISPGMVNTPLIQGLSSFNQEMFDKDTKKYALQRYGEPEEIAHLAAFLLSDASAWISGANYLIDGGSNA